MPVGISAVSFDFFNTLVTHRHGRGRGALVMEYFRAQGWTSDPWDHAVLYDVFATHGPEFTPGASIEAHRVFCARVARTLFRRLRIQADSALADAHAAELWRILGPAHLTLFPETDAALGRLRAAGYRLVIVSNWQCGLGAFCHALGLGDHFEAILASAEVGAAKPDSRIFTEACRRLALPPDRVLHVGDSAADDIEGARQAGLRALWLRRALDRRGTLGLVRSLDEVAERLGAV